MLLIFLIQLCFYYLIRFQPRGLLRPNLLSKKGIFIIIEDFFKKMQHLLQTIRQICIKKLPDNFRLTILRPKSSFRRTKIYSISFYLKCDLTRNKNLKMFICYLSKSDVLEVQNFQKHLRKWRVNKKRKSNSLNIIKVA